MPHLDEGSLSGKSETIDVLNLSASFDSIGSGIFLVMPVNWKMVPLLGDSTMEVASRP